MESDARRNLLLDSSEINVSVKNRGLNVVQFFSLIFLHQDVLIYRLRAIQLERL